MVRFHGEKRKNIVDISPHEYLNNLAYGVQYMESSVSTPVFSYQIEFPPGPHGLELEPVIISSERSIGCRVKGFHFDLDHEGISKDYLESAIEIGDILCSINDTNILSVSFDAILSMLKSIRDRERVLSFKNVSTSCI